jgi:Nif-specific regulatory protein
MAEEAAPSNPPDSAKLEPGPLERLHAVLSEIAIKTKERLKADRLSVFLFDRAKCELWSIISQEKKIMRLDARLGIAGRVAMTGESVNVPDAYEHPLFYREVDIQTGYRTRTLLAVPLKNHHGEIIGVGEAINKADGHFTIDDATALQALADHVAESIAEMPNRDRLFRDLLVQDRSAEQDNGIRFTTQKIVGMSHKIEAIIRLVDQIRDSSVDVLIQGESGTGKELIARALHENSPRYHRPFVALNCAALPDNLIEAELFGIEKGVATGVDRRIGKFEAANGGTLFLDEIGDLSLNAQAKILRVLQERLVDRVGGGKPTPIDVRVIAATNKNLETAIKERNFREDLYYRLKVIHIHMPPLRDNPADIALLANHFLAKYCGSMNTEPKQFTTEALTALSNYEWPGNARQLENEVKRLVASVRGKSITEDHLDPAIRNVETPVRKLQAGEVPATEVLPSHSLPVAVEALERRMIEQALRETAGNKQKAAQVLGLSRQGLIKKLKRLAIPSAADK